MLHIALAKGRIAKKVMKSLSEEKLSKEEMERKLGGL